MEIIRYNWQLLCVKRCGKIYTIICFLGNEFLLSCNYSLPNSLLYHELKCLDWIGLWWWWFGVVWIILISLIIMNCYVYSLAHLQGESRAWYIRRAEEWGIKNYWIFPWDWKNYCIWFLLSVISFVLRFFNEFSFGVAQLLADP